MRFQSDVIIYFSLLFLSFVLLLLLFFSFECVTGVRLVSKLSPWGQINTSLVPQLESHVTRDLRRPARSCSRVDYFYGSLIDKQGKGPRSVDCFELHFSAIHEKNQIIEVVDCRFAFEGPK